MEYKGFIGSYTGDSGGGCGIYSFTFDGETGEIKDIRFAAKADNPEFFVFSRSRKFLYTTNELTSFNLKGFGDIDSGAVSAFALNEDGELLFIGASPSMGLCPCHISLDESGSFAFVSNYSDGSLAVLPVLPDGSLGACVQLERFEGSGPIADRQERSHAHSFVIRGSVGIACDLGSDRLRRFRIDAGQWRPLTSMGRAFESEAGAGPRHTLFHPVLDIVYAVNELSCTVDVLSINDDCLLVKQTIPLLLCSDVSTYEIIRPTAAAIKAGSGFYDNGAPRFLYVSVRGPSKKDNLSEGAIAVLRVKEDGLLEQVALVPSGGAGPRDFAVDPSGKFLIVCHQESHNIVVFRIDAETGVPRKIHSYCTDEQNADCVRTPVCILFM